MITQKFLSLKKFNHHIAKLDNSTKLFFLVLLVSIILRVIFISSVPLTFHIDEIYMLESAQKILNGQDLLKTHFSTTVISNFITAISVYTFGFNAFSVRAQSIILGIFANIFLYLFTKNIFGKRTGLVAFSIASFMHLSIAYSRINLPCIWGPFLLSASLYFFSKLEFMKNKKNLYMLGTATGLSFYTYTGAKIVGMVFIILIPILSVITNKRKWVNYLIFFGIPLVILLFPLLLYSLIGGNYLERENQVFIFKIPGYIQDRLGVDNILHAILIQFQTIIEGFFFKQDYSNQYGNSPLLDPITGFFLLFSIPFLFSHFLAKTLPVKKSYTLFLSTIFLLILIFVATTESPPLSTRLLITYPIAAIFSAIGLIAFFEILLYQKNALKNIFITGTIFLILLLNIHNYFLHYPSTHDFNYWFEPNSTITASILSSKDRKYYIYSNPHSYATMPYLRVLNQPNNNVLDINDQIDIPQLLLKSEKSTIIIPPSQQQPIYPETLLSELVKNKSFKTISVDVNTCKKCVKSKVYIFEKN